MNQAIGNHAVKEFFTETEWDMIYNFIGNALDDDDYDSFKSCYHIIWEDRETRSDMEQINNNHAGVLNTAHSIVIVLLLVQSNTVATVPQRSLARYRDSTATTLVQQARSPPFPS